MSSSLQSFTPSADAQVGFVPVVESCPRQDHGVVVGPFGGVAPAGSGAVPVVAPRRITNDTLRKTLPHDEGEIHLWEQRGQKEEEKRRGGEDGVGGRGKVKKGEVM